jgi:hypothetical protein
MMQEHAKVNVVCSDALSSMVNSFRYTCLAFVVSIITSTDLSSRW